MGFVEHMESMPKKKKVVKKAEKPVAPKIIEKIIEKPIAPIVKVVNQPDYSPMVVKQSAETGKLAQQAIASMRDSVNNNQAVMAEIVARIAVRPKEFLIVRDGQGDMTKIIPVYENG
ncbi:MAG: hypothetical protein KAR06_03780 [Deltaproteobacteria bacterium]|nr:hypothetical protein [Deltaproteobacteria bacterium]